MVVPVFNVYKHIGPALDSIRAQTIPPNEVILIDDGSTDGSSEVLESYVGQPGWSLIKISNNGLGPARNLGRLLAKSEYIYFFDSDDLLGKDFIERMYAVIEAESHPDLIMFSGKTFYDEGYSHPYFPDYQRTITGQYSQYDHLLSTLSRHSEIWSQACLYLSKAKLWHENRMFYPPVVHEDEAVLFPLIALSQKTVVLKDVYFFRRIRAGSIMTSGIDERNVSGALRVLTETMAFMASNGEVVYRDQEAWRVRVAQFGSYYVDACRHTRTKIAWYAVASSLLVARNFRYPFRLIFAFLPRHIRDCIRSIQKTYWVRKEQQRS